MIQRRTLLLWLVLVAGCFTPTSQQSGGLVSLHPAMTETLFAIGAGDQLVGRSDYCTTPQEALSLPTFGTALTPEIEALANLHPDTVLLDDSFGAKVGLIQGVVPVTSLPWLTKEDIVSSTLALGKQVHAETQATQLAERYKTQLWGTPGPQAPTAILLMGNGDLTVKNLWYIKPDSVHGSALASAGFRNSVPVGIQGPPSMSLEQLIAYDPDVLLVISSATDGDNILKSLRQMTPLKAVRSEQVHIIEGEHVMSNGPGILNLVKALQAVEKPTP